MNRARTIERQAASLREDLARLASGEGCRLATQRTIDGMRYQLELAQRLADESEGGPEQTADYAIALETTLPGSA